MCGYKEKVEKFDSFRRKELCLQGAASSIEGAYSVLKKGSSDFDAFIVGSDIVWGKEFSGLESPYFLKHAPEGVPHIAYAASVIIDAFGHTENDELFRKELPNFTSIGIRETSSNRVIQELSRRNDVMPVLDPTLLLDVKDYEPIEEDVMGYMGEPYMLSYFLTHDPAVVDYSNMIAKKLGLRIIHYFADYPTSIFPDTSECFAFTGPGEFLSLVKNASIVFTNSFHGTCFSMIYRKPFYTYTAKRNMLSRVKDTVTRLRMQNRYYTDFRDLKNVTMEIDYSIMEKRLKELKRDSLMFLNHALEGIYV